MEYNYENQEECFHKLPCGICRLTNMPCPKVKSNTPTYISNTSNPLTPEEVKQRFIVVTDDKDFNCPNWNSVRQVFENNEINNYIIRYYEGDQFKGGYTYKALEEKLGVK